LLLFLCSDDFETSSFKPYWDRVRQKG